MVMRALSLKITDWFAALSRREKILVIMAGSLAAATFGVYAVTMPLLHEIGDKRAQYFVALERRAMIEAQIAAAPAANGNIADSAAGPLQQLMSQSAIGGGFAIDRVDARGPDTVIITMAKAKPGAFMVWLDTWEARGVDASELTITAGNDGTAAIAATLTRRPR
jgi:general secretion pathway protein M